MERIKLKKRKSIGKVRLYFFMLLFVFIFVFFIVLVINNEITPMAFELGEIEINKFSTIIINDAVDSVINNEININDIFSMIKSKDDRIQSVDFNTIYVNKILKSVNFRVQKSLKLFEKGNLKKLGIDNIFFTQNKNGKLVDGVILEVPIGIIFKNTILSGFGPKIPVKFHYLGNINSNVVTNVKTYGINNAIVEVGIKIDITVQIILPFTTRRINLGCYVPIAIKIIQGIVPNYYSNGLEDSSNIYSLPF